MKFVPCTLFTMCLLVVICLPQQVKAEISLSNFQEPSGIITVLPSGDVADPYFAMKALLLSSRYGYPLKEESTRWINWRLKQQTRFQFTRLCKKASVWKPCYGTDADDVLYVMWHELLLVHMAPESMPEIWKGSIAASEKALAALYDDASGLYFISPSQPVALLMDNIEIAASFRNISEHYKTYGVSEKAEIYSQKSADLERAIIKQFYDVKTGYFTVSTQGAVRDTFYPYAVAQLYPFIFDIGNKQLPDNAFEQWFDSWGEEWLGSMQQEYPWGLVALAASKAEHKQAEYCWLQISAQYRFSRSWNVLEDVLYQYLHQDIAWPLEPSNTIECPL